MPRSPQGKGPQRFGRSDARWSPGERLAGMSGWKRVSAARAKWPWSVIQSTNATFCVGSGWCPGAASGAMTTTTTHTTPDTPSDRQEWSRRRRATDRQAAARRRGAVVIFACDSRATRRGPRGVGGGRRGQPREHNEDAPALRRSFFQAGGLRPPRCSMISAESSESRPSRYAVASRALTRRPRSRGGSYKEDGEEQGTEQLAVRSACDSGRQITVVGGPSRSIKDSDTECASAYLPSSAP
jgi:hypothetical protein